MSANLETAQLEVIADRLRAASDACRAIDPIRGEFASDDVASAYAIQDYQTRARLADGWRLVGRKIGLTAKSVQAQLGVDQPDFGMLFDRIAIANGGTVPVGRLIAPRCEAEIAFVLGSDLDLAAPTERDARAAVASVSASIEIVDSRIANWDIKIVDTVADNASSGLFVLGTERVALDAFDLLGCAMTLEKNGAEVSSGTGAACLGSPLNALVWLAAKLHEVGRPLRAGDVVLSGALGPMVAAQPGDLFEARIEGLGSVRVSFDGEAHA